MYSGTSRSASCVAGPKGAVLAELSRGDFDQLLAGGNPFAFALLDLIASQLARRLNLAVDVMRDAALEQGWVDPE